MDKDNSEQAENILNSEPSPMMSPAKLVARSMVSSIFFSCFKMKGLMTYNINQGIIICIKKNIFEKGYVAKIIRLNL